MSESGLRSTIGNRVYAKSVSGVRIPISPPVIFRKRLFWALSFSPAPLVADTYFGRVAERLNAAVSKTVLPVLPVTRVQIPPLPPAYKGLPLAGLLHSLALMDGLCSLAEFGLGFSACESTLGCIGLGEKGKDDHGRSCGGSRKRYPRRRR